MKRLKENYSDMILDRRVTGGSSTRRPDGYIDLETHAIIVEIDENQHHQNKYTRDINRDEELLNDINKPLVIIRLNPDQYRLNGACIEGVFYYENNVLKTRVDAFDKRLNLLISSIDNHIRQIPTEPLTIVKHYFDE
jgi:hypothetical protein